MFRCLYTLQRHIPVPRIFPHCTDEEFMAEENPQIPFSGIMAGGTGPTIATGNPFSPRMALLEQGGLANDDVTTTSTGMEARWVDLSSTQPRGEPSHEKQQGPSGHDTQETLGGSSLLIRLRDCWSVETPAKGNDSTNTCHNRNRFETSPATFQAVQHRTRPCGQKVRLQFVADPPVSPSALQTDADLRPRAVLAIAPPYFSGSAALKPSSDAELLYFTLVEERVLLPGHFSSFLSLSNV